MVTSHSGLRLAWHRALVRRGLVHGHLEVIEAGLLGKAGVPGGVLFDTTLLGPVHRGVAGLALHGSVAARVLRARQWTVFGVHMVDPSLKV